MGECTTVVVVTNIEDLAVVSDEVSNTGGVLETSKTSVNTKQ